MVIRAIAREPGVRTKIAVFSNQSGVDPVGSCVGQKGVRVQAVTNELGGERVDIIPWSESLEDLLVAALSPAEGLSVKLDKDKKTAKVKAPEDQLPLAIGKDGQNVRLAAKLTGVRIEVETTGELSEKAKAQEAEVALEKKTKEPETETEKIEKKEAVAEDTKTDQAQEKVKSQVDQVEPASELQTETEKQGEEEVVEVEAVETPGEPEDKEEVEAVPAETPEGPKEEEKSKETKADEQAA